MNRPLIQNGIGELERMFEACQTDPRTLEALEFELHFRSVPRAATLLNQVRRASAGAPVAPALSQESLFEEASPPARQDQFPITTSLPEGAVSKQESPSRLRVSVEDACQILKVTPNAPWNTIEESRRALVELSRPNRLAKVNDEKRQALREEAQRANAALDSLLQARRAK